MLNLHWYCPRPSHAPLHAGGGARDDGWLRKNFQTSDSDFSMAQWRLRMYFFQTLSLSSAFHHCAPCVTHTHTHTHTLVLDCFFLVALELKLLAPELELLIWDRFRLQCQEDVGEICCVRYVPLIILPSL